MTSLEAHNAAMEAADRRDYLAATLAEIECLRLIVEEDRDRDPKRRLKTICITARSLFWLALKAWKQREGRPL